MVQPNREFELKLSLRPDEFDRLAANPKLTGNGGKSSQKALRSIYYDTPDLRLRNQGLTLRVRHDGESYVQTIKAETQLRNGLSNPIEVEDRVEGVSRILIASVTTASGANCKKPSKAWSGLAPFSWRGSVLGSR